ncbi:hypothetical protein QOZ80_5BG0456310 [Eleusine coracana subsp. coracana]|nr:hypothetical protein QOZ80_5BG0456310 [Eleusine coracana subsp. coracana]
MDAAATTTTAAAAADVEAEDQAQMAAITDRLQTRDSMRLYNWLSQRCFSECVVTFYRKSLGKGEADCVRACVRKYLLLTTTSAARFAELAGTAPSDDD